MGCPGVSAQKLPWKFVLVQLKCQLSKNLVHPQTSNQRSWERNTTQVFSLVLLPSKRSSCDSSIWSSCWEAGRLSECSKTWTVSWRAVGAKDSEELLELTSDLSRGMIKKWEQNLLSISIMNSIRRWRSDLEVFSFSWLSVDRHCFSPEEKKLEVRRLDTQEVVCKWLLYFNQETLEGQTDAILKVKHCVRTVFYAVKNQQAEKLRAERLEQTPTTQLHHPPISSSEPA